MPKLIIVIGSLLAATGAICFLALSDQGQSDAIRSLGSACFAVGVLAIACGIYLQARKLQPATETPSASKTKKTERLCSSCNREPSVLFCRVHVLRLCLDCFEKHDDGTNCSYVPARRATAAYK
jgi:hypothetical protein